MAILSDSKWSYSPLMRIERLGSHTLEAQCLIAKWTTRKEGVSSLLVYYLCSATLNSRGGRMSRAPASLSGRSANPKMVDSSLELMGSKPGQVKPKTLTLILVLPSLVLGIIRIRQGLVGSVSG